jgi:hypothetical protein
MKISRLLLVPALLVGLSTWPQFCRAQGSMIWSDTFANAGGSLGIINEAEFWFGGPPYSFNYPTQPLFNQIFFGTNDVGRTFTIASSADDPNFNFVVNTLTNGVDQTLAVLIGLTNGTGSLFPFPESQLFAGVGTGPDLIGYQIQSFGLRVDSLSFQSPGSNPNSDGNWTDYSEQFTLSIYGSQVPEPSSVAVVLLGGGILLYLRKRRRFRP